MLKTYIIRTRYLEDGGWRTEEEEVTCSYDEAGRKASNKAKELDAKYGNTHFWNVYLNNGEGESYFELFHGRTS